MWASVELEEGNEYIEIDGRVENSRISLVDIVDAYVAGLR